MRALKKSMDERRLRDQKEVEIGGLKTSINVLGLRKERQSKAVDYSNNNDWSQFHSVIIQW